MLHYYAYVGKNLLVFKEHYLREILLDKFLKVMIYSFDELMLQRKPLFGKLSLHLFDGLVQLILGMVSPLFDVFLGLFELIGKELFELEIRKFLQFRELFLGFLGKSI